jgi:hydroxymethylglutaryl-CoA synthase
MTTEQFGISGFAVFAPPHRVQLKEWCEWTGSSWDKTRAVVGNSFRVVGAEHSVYTMAANAVLNLIEQYSIDPRTVGYLALGTESGTDNATSGAVVVRGLVDQALIARGKPPLARDIEAPEFKQACIGGVYALKGALRYLAVDGLERTAIVVACDIAEYARGSSGEPTQGAGAVAMLVEKSPKLLALDVRRSASASSYRAVDFRKPFLRYCGQTPGRDGRPRDFPVFNGKYSTACYIDETMSALQAFFAKQGGSRRGYYHSLGSVFMHRPYHKMPVAAWTLGYLFALGADGGAGHEELAGYAVAAGVDLPALLAEMRSSPNLLADALAGKPVEEPFPLTSKLVKPFRESAAYREYIEGKMKLGSGTMMELGNLYCAALPGWVAAGMEEAAERALPIEGQEWLLVGYGSGDTSEVLPARVVPGWQRAAAKIGFSNALANGVDLSRENYEALHDGREPAGLASPVARGFVIDRIGREDSPKFQDYGIEYYRYLG